MKRINYIGLDMDHTLVRYNSAEFENLAHTILCKKLVETLGYPQETQQLKFSYDYAIRGLVIDKKNGNLLKLSRYGAIRASRHGIHRITYREQQKKYKSIYIDLADNQYEAIDTSFSIAFAALFAQIVHLKNENPSLTLPDYKKIADDINDTLDTAHSDGSLKSIVASDVGRYILRNENLIKNIQRYKKHGKKFFIVTNSQFQYTKLLLDYAINPYLEKGETWQDLFEHIITDAKKPSFFYKSDLPIKKINPKNGEESSVADRGALDAGVYSGGCAARFTEGRDIRPDQILYVGDHIYGDILRLKKDCAWRTALVVEELGEEIKNNKKAAVTREKINALMDEKIPLEQKIDDLISQQIENENSECKDEIKSILSQVESVDQKISQFIRKHDNFYNSYWGELMRTGIEKSFFADQVERFACIYMSQLNDLLELPARSYFRSRRHPLAHDES